MEDARVVEILNGISARIDAVAALQQEMATSFEVFVQVHKKQEIDFRDQKEKILANCKAVTEIQKMQSNNQIKFEQQTTICLERRSKLNDLTSEFVDFKDKTNQTFTALKVSNGILATKVVGGGLIGGFLASIAIRILF